MLPSEPQTATLRTVKEGVSSDEATVVRTPIKTPDKRSTVSKIPSLMPVKTPENKTPNVLPEEEQHPQRYHASTAKPLDEARWLGFLAKGAHTEPIKAQNKLAVVQGTPTKTPLAPNNPFSTPDFKFRYKQPSLELSPAAKKMMEESRAEAAKIRAQMVSDVSNAGQTGEQNHSLRKIAQPKGKAGRFSEVHMAEFKKMDSIASHPSVTRIDPSKLKPCTTTLKRKQSKADLYEPKESSRATKTTTKLIDAASNAETDAPVKRIKRNDGEDASSTRPKSQDGVLRTPSTPQRLFGPRPGTSRFASRLFTPTKASIARTQSAKSLRTTMIPSLIRSPSVKSVTESKAKLERTLKEQIRKTSDSIAARLPGIKSILRSPQRLYSNDPLKIAAGTHIKTPPSKINLTDYCLVAPATAPVAKHVAFTESTVERFEQRNASSTSPCDQKSSGHEEPLSYPELPGSATTSTYPTFPDSTAIGTAQQISLDNTTGSFTFRSNRSISFESGPRQTIRRVRLSNASEFVREPERKRKLDDLDESESYDKENVAEEESLVRPVKKIRVGGQDHMEKTPRSSNINRNRIAGGLSRSRLNLLALPKRRKT